MLAAAGGVAWPVRRWARARSRVKFDPALVLRLSYSIEGKISRLFQRSASQPLCAWARGPPPGTGTAAISWLYAAQIVLSSLSALEQAWGAVACGLRCRLWVCVVRAYCALMYVRIVYAHAADFCIGITAVSLQSRDVSAWGGRAGVAGAFPFWPHSHGPVLDHRHLSMASSPWIQTSRRQKRLSFFTYGHRPRLPVHPPPLVSQLIRGSSFRWW